MRQPSWLLPRIATAALATPATAAASPSWQLTDQYTANPACFTTGAGVVTSSSPGPIPPGSSNGTGPFTVNSQTFGEAYVVTGIASGLAQNSTFTLTFWASDGTTTQTESVPVVIKASCKRKY